jgi:hypothetical protein
MTKTFTGNVKPIPLSRCDCCGALVDYVERVITLRGNRDNPTEYANACPECSGLDSFTDVESIVAAAAKRLSASTEIEVEWWLRKRKMNVADAKYVIEQAKVAETVDA